MMKSYAYLGCLAASILCATASNVADDLLLGRELANGITWTGVVELGKPEMKIVGTAEEVYHKILEINPNYDIELGVLKNKTDGENSDLKKRFVRSPTSSDYTCAYGTYVSVTPIDVGIQYLYNIGDGLCAAPAGAPGAGGCARTSCSEAAGIWLCNDNSFQIQIPCRLVADNAVEILIKCQQTSYVNNDWRSVVRGQIFASDRSWNVIINTPGASC